MHRRNNLDGCFDIALDGEWRKVSGASPANPVGIVALRLQLESIGSGRFNGEQLAAGRGAIACATARHATSKQQES